MKKLTQEETIAVIAEKQFPAYRDSELKYSYDNDKRQEGFIAGANYVLSHQEDTVKDEAMAFAKFIGEKGYNKHQCNDIWYDGDQSDFRFTTSELFTIYQSERKES